MAVILGRKGGGAGGGGSLPDPSGEPDGDVLTVSGGTAVWSPGGGSQTNDQNAAYIGHLASPVSIANNDNDLLPWDELGSGEALLDLAVPTQPTVLAAGIYAVSATAKAAEALTAGGYFQLVLHLNKDDQDAISQIFSNVVPANTETMAGVSLVFYVPLGGVIAVEVINYDGAASRGFYLAEALIQRIS